MFGALATGLLASKAINSAGADGLFYRNASLLGVQALSIVAASVFAFGMTWLILNVLDSVMGLRVNVEEEVEGLDLSQHCESGYIF